MKQHITKKQWDELNKKEKDVLLEYFNNKIEELHSDLAIRINDYFDITIGQLIEFLGDEQLLISSDGGLWTVVNKYMKFIFTKEELIDALWEAVKYKLAREEAFNIFKGEVEKRKFK